MPAFHITIAAEGRTTLFPEDSLLRRAAITIARVGGVALRLFCVVDDHIHAVVDVASKLAAGHVAGAIARAFVWRQIAIQPAHIREVDGRRHLETLIGYLVRQPSKHGLKTHPVLWSGSCAPDLLGARCLPGFDSRAIARDLPRVDVARCAMVSAGLPPAPLRPAGTANLRALGAARLWTATLAALALPVPPEGKSAIVLRARAAYCALSREAEIPAREARWASSLAETTWERVTKATPDPALVSAVRMRLALEDAVATPSPRSTTTTRSNETRRCEEPPDLGG